MPESVTLEQIETLVVQLSAKDQLRLLAYISACLSSPLPVMPAVENPNEQRVLDERLQLATLLCAEVENITNDTLGEFDAADDIQRMHEERTSQLCRNDV